MGTEAWLDGLGGRVRRHLEDTLDPRETVRALVRGRGKEALVLTDRRIILASGSMVGGGSDSLLLRDVSRVTAGLTAISIQLRNGDAHEYSFWPSGGNRDAAKEFVQLFRSDQLSEGEPEATKGGIADELGKLARLRDEGTLTEDEFREQKAILLANG